MRKKITQRGGINGGEKPGLKEFFLSKAYSIEENRN